MLLILLVDCMQQWAAVCHYFLLPYEYMWIFLGDYLSSFFPLVFCHSISSSVNLFYFHIKGSLEQMLFQTPVFCLIAWKWGVIIF